MVSTQRLLNNDWSVCRMYIILISYVLYVLQQGRRDWGYRGCKCTPNFWQKYLSSILLETKDPHQPHQNFDTPAALYILTKLSILLSSVRQDLQIDTWVPTLLPLCLRYFSVPNRRVGWNNSVGWIFRGKNNKCVGWINPVG